MSAMWRLQPVESETGAVCLLPGKEYVVGRKNCDILLTNDQSISRVHAQLTVTEQTVTLKDSSKYGTFVNEERLTTGSHKSLKAGDRVTFGVFQSKFRLEQESVVVCSSCIDNEGKVALSQAMQAIGGRLVNTWTQECTHLVMPAVKVTIKTICALLCGRPIVRPEFFTELSRAMQRRDTLPKAESFRPKLDEPSLTKQNVDLNPRTERKSLFEGKTFVFLNAKQMKRLSQAISCGGGRSQLLEEGSLPISILESSETCVVDVSTGSSQNLVPPATKKWVDSVGQVLHRNGLRFITESEIGLAAIYVDNQNYCNPQSTVNSESLGAKQAIPEATLSQSTAVNETVLPAASQNITAYVVNTEPSQGINVMNVCGATAVGETPEKRPVQVKQLGSSRPSTSSSRPSTTLEQPNTRAVPDIVKSSASALNTNERREKKTTPSWERKRAPASQDRGATLTKSPQKQSSLTSFFQPVSKKRAREDSANSEQSEAKLPRQDPECEKHQQTKDSNLATSQNITSSSLFPTSSHASQNKNGTTPRADFGASLGLGSSLGTSSGPRGAHQAQSCDPDVKKRKEPIEEQQADPDLDLSLEELESLMSDDMDEPVQPAANKRQRLDQVESGAADKVGDQNQSSGASSGGRYASQNRNTAQDKPSAASSGPGSEKKSQTLSNRMQYMEQGEYSSTHRRDRYQSEDVKEEEVSFLVESKAQSADGQHTEAGAVKQESKNISLVSGSENNAELPSKLVQVQFKSLTVSAPSRTRGEALQSRDPNGKNFKRFRKVPVPGLQGLPNIIGGSDLVAHNRSKNSELEEWLRDAAEEEKQQQREETLGDDLFRYNPKPAKRR